MMRNLVGALLLLLLGLLLSRCEKDDICDQNTPTTPRLVIRFFDANNPTVPKNVTQLSVIGLGMEVPLGVFNGVSTIQIPLATTQDQTQYRFILNSTNQAILNEDNLGFFYQRENIFVSRACGYKTIFELDPLTAPDLSAGADGAWIQWIEIITPAINSENDTHLHLYF
jgi:hypothetical protein